MKAKKFLAVLLAMVLCVGALAACDSKPAETTAPAAQSTTAPAAQDTTAPAAEDTTEAAPLTNVERYPIDFDGTLTAACAKGDAAEAHNYLLWEELTGVDIEWQPLAQDQLPLMFVGGTERPDIFFSVGGITQAQLNEYGQAGMLINYMDYLDQMPNLKAAYENDPRLFDAVKDANGDVYTLPYYCYTLTMASNIFYIRTDMTKEAGIEELPTTIEGFLEMCETLQNYYADVEGYQPMVANGESSMRYNGAYCNFFFPAFGELMEAGITVALDNKTIAAGFATEQYKNYVTFMNTLYEEGYMDPDCFVSDSNTNKARLIDKTTTMNPFATYLTPDNFASGELDFQVMPALSSQYQSEARWTIPNRYRSVQYMISTDCSDLNAALALYDALFSPMEDPIKDENGVKAWGISLWLGEMGEDFALNEEEGSYEILPHEGFDSSSAWLSVAGHGGAAYLNWPYYENSGTGLMIKAIYSREMTDTYGVQVLSSSLLTLTQEEQDIYNDAWTDINTKVTEMNAAFITGQKDIEAEWDSYIKDLYDMGLQDVIDVYQAALDRYNAG